MLLWIALAGGAGAVLRLLVDAGVARLVPVRVPVATTLINVTGSFALGLLLGAASTRPGWDVACAVLGTGFLGGYTTFSTAMVEVVTVAERRERRSVAAAAAGTVAMLTIALGAAALGWAAGAR